MCTASDWYTYPYIYMCIQGESEGVASASMEFSNASKDSHCALLFTSLPSPSCLSSSSCPCPPATACRKQKGKS